MRTSSRAHRFTRRALLRGSAGVVGLSALGCPAPAAAPRPPPNVLLLTADDLGWRDLSCSGNEQVRTPHIDRLAAEGASFARAFDVSSSCSSSRASFITGQYPHTHGVVGLTHVHPEFSLPASHRALPRLLYDGGWSTALHGKWHVAPFDPVEDHGYAELLNDVPLPHFLIDTVDDTIAFLERQRGARWYLEVNFMHTHRDDDGGFAVPAGFEVDPSSIVVPPYWSLPDRPEIRADVARYYGRMRAMDALVGELLDALERLGLADSTLVVFVSDNGPPFPGNKTTLYDRGTGTPLLLRWPGVIDAGRVLDPLVSTIDVMPTILDACGLTIPADVQGRSLLPLATGDDDGADRSAVFAEMTYHEDHIPMRSARTARFKYIRNYSDAPIGLGDAAHAAWAQELTEWQQPRVPEELYDLDADPNERENLVDAAPDVLADMRARLDAHLQATADPLLGAPFSLGGEE